MDLNTQAPEQLRALTAGMRKLAEQDTPPSPEMWQQHFVTWLIERADFVDRYITPKLEKLYQGEKLPLHPPLTAPHKTALVEPPSIPFLSGNEVKV